MADAPRTGSSATAPPRPYVLASVAMSVDGYIDSSGPERLLLSGADDLDRVDEVRAGVDAILIGAGTLRRDNPRLLVRSAQRLARRAGVQPIKVVLTGSGEIDPAARFFTEGDAAALVYAASPGLEVARLRLGGAAPVLDAGHPLDLGVILTDLAARGVARLMVEGGQSVHTQFLTAGLVDELHLVIAPFFVGDPAAPRFVGQGSLPHGPGHPMRLVAAHPIGEVVLMRYLLGSADPVC